MTQDRSRFQSGEVKRLHRSEIRGADYNPRKISSTAAKRLRQSLKSHGLMGPALILNETTGVLVSGHQRLAQLDQLEKSADYQLDVTVVRLTQEEEKEANVLLNNTGAMGSFDVLALGALLEDGKVDSRKMGFSDLDLELTFQGTEYAKDLTPDAVPAIESDVHDIAKRAEAIRKVKDARARQKQQWAELSANDHEFYAVLVFKNRSECDAFIAGVDGNLKSRFLDGPELADRLGIALPPRS